MRESLAVAVFLLVCVISNAQDVDKLILNNKLDKALEVLDSLLHSDQPKPQLLCKKGIIFQKKYQYSKARDCFEKAYRLDSSNAEVVSELADANANLGYHKEAISYYRYLYRLDTTNSINAIRYSRACFNVRSYKEPYQILAAVYRNDTTNVYIAKQLAYSAQRIGNDSLAIALYRRMVELNPSDLNNYTNLTALYQKKENYEAAVTTTEKGLQIFPNENMLLNKLGDLHYYKRVYDKAIGSYESILASGDSIPDVMKNLGISYYYGKDYEKGLNLLEKCLIQKPNDPVTSLFIGLCLKELKKTEDSIAYLNFASKICIPYYLTDIYHQLGVVYLEKKEYKKSVSYLKKAYYQDTTKNDILFKIANTYDVWQKDKTQAIRYYNRFLNAKSEKTELNRQLVDYSQERIGKLIRTR